MILTYYQAVELMTVLPTLLSHTGAKTIQETTLKSANATADDTNENTGVYEMWNMPTQGMEVNGYDFY
jgi:hypothetical protein